jgi:RecG-like helicase
VIGGRIRNITAPNAVTLDDMSSEGGRFRRAFQRLSASNEDLEASDIRKVCDGHRMARISDVHDREYVKVGGTVKQVALAPRAGTPTLEATLYDGTGSVTVVFLGRRRMAGVDPGVQMEVVGRICERNGQRVVFNPRYELWV